MAIFQFIQGLLSEASVLIALIAFIGLVIQKKSVSDVLRGTIKTFLGFIILGAGANVVVGAITPFGQMFQFAFKTQGVVPNNEAIIAMALEKYGGLTAQIMLFGMIANMFIARFTRLKYIFLTGHHTLYMACMIAVILMTINMGSVMTVVVGSVALGLTMVIFPAMGQSTMRILTKKDEVAMGHFSTIGYALSAKIGKLVGKNSKSTEEINFPRSLAFLRDSSVSISITMTVIYIILAIAAGPKYIEAELSGGKNFLVYAIIQGVTFAAGVYIILQGVRLVLAEILPAFRGISQKLIPGARPALDCPVVYPFAPNGALIGFFSSFVGGIVGMLALVLTKGVIILPGVVPHFFVGATAGVFGNATGGVRGCVIGSFINGLLLTFAPLILMPLLGNLGFANTTFSDLDFIATGFILGRFGQFGTIVVSVLVFGVLAGLIIYNYVAPKKATKTK